MTPRRPYMPIALALLLIACAGSPAIEPVAAYTPAAESTPSVLCHAALAGTRVDGRPLVMARCRTFELAMAAYHTEVIYLRDLVRGGRDVAAIGDQEIRKAQEYQSYMDSRNRWQWQLHVTQAEALAACRAMLVDLAAGEHVDWETQAREYLMRVRFARAPPASGSSPARPAHPRGSSGAAPSQPGSAPARPRGPGNTPHATDSPGTAPVTTSPSGPRVPVRIYYYYRFDDDWHLLDSLRASGRHTVADRLERLLDSAGTQLAAVTILLSGTSILITGLSTPAGVLELSILADGAVPADMALATRTAEPALQELAETVHEIEQLKSNLAPFESLTQPGLDTLMEPRSDTLGWGRREHTVRIGNEKRVLDIADPENLRGVEVKTGYVSLTADVAYELKRDALLVLEENWDIHWFVDGRMSEPLRKALRTANIRFTETKPTTLIEDL